jgi:hypothetical protein
MKWVHSYNSKSDGLLRVYNDLSLEGNRIESIQRTRA